MKKSTLIGCFIGLLGLTLNAQIPQPNSTTLNGTNTIEVQKKSSSSFEALLERYNNTGNYSGPVSDHFTLEEQQKLRSYFQTQNLRSSSKPVNQSATVSSRGGDNGPLTTFYGIDNYTQDLFRIWRSNSRRNRSFWIFSNNTCFRGCWRHGPS